MDKKTGYVLLLSGVWLILFSALMMWRVFTGTSSPPVAIDIQTLTIPLPATQFTPPGNKFNMPLDPQFSKMANMSIYFLLMFFLASAGNKIATLGVKLIKPGTGETKKPGTAN